MLNSFVLLALIQLVIAIVGLFISVFALHEALVAIQILRRLRLNGIREIVAFGDVLDEISRFLCNAIILGATIFLMTELDNVTVPWYNQWSRIFVNILLAVSSINRIVTRRKVINLMEITNHTPKRRVGDNG